MRGECWVTSNAARDDPTQNSLLTTHYSPPITHRPLPDPPSSLGLVALRRPSSQLASVADPLPEVGAVEPGAEEEQEGADHDGDGAVPPGVAPQERGGHA